MKRWASPLTPGLTQLVTGWILASGLAGVSPEWSGRGFGICVMAIAFLALGAGVAAGWRGARGAFAAACITAMVAWFVIGFAVATDGSTNVLSWMNAIACLIGAISLRRPSPSRPQAQASPAPPATRPSGSPPARAAQAVQRRAEAPGLTDAERAHALKAAHRYAEILGLSDGDDVLKATTKYMELKKRYGRNSHPVISEIIDDAFGHLNSPQKRMGCALCDRLADECRKEILRLAIRALGSEQSVRQPFLDEARENAWSAGWQAVVTYNGTGGSGNGGGDSLEEAIRRRMQRVVERYRVLIDRSK